MDHYPVGVLCDYLAEQPRVWIRLAAKRLNADWQLSLFEVVVTEPPPGWRRQRWSYGRAVFVASTPAGKSVARWLERARIVLPSLSIELELDGSADVERRDSNSLQGIYQQLPWPTREWKVNTRNSSGQAFQDELIAADTPAFISFDQAAAAFLRDAVEAKPQFLWPRDRRPPAGSACPHRPCAAASDRGRGQGERRAATPHLAHARRCRRRSYQAALAANPRGSPTSDRGTGQRCMARPSS
jgi:hypothetical protein